MIKSLNDIFNYAKSNESQTLAVVAPEDTASLEAVGEAIKNDLIKAIFIGNQKLIEKHMEELNMSSQGITFIDVPEHIDAARKAVEKVHSGEAQILMKGTIHTEDILRAVLDKTVGLRGKNLLSHALVFEIPGLNKLCTLTDAAMNIAPDFLQKTEILENAAILMRDITGIERPKAALLAAVETVNPKMQATLDAAYIAKMSQRGQLKNIIADGPLGLDNAISAESAKIKGITSEVAGDPDILLVPDIEAGNILYKFMTVISGLEGAGVILGAAAPIVLTSRADDMKTKLNSIALASMATMKGNKK